MQIPIFYCCTHMFPLAPQNKSLYYYKFYGSEIWRLKSTSGIVYLFISLSVQNNDSKFPVQMEAGVTKNESSILGQFLHSPVWCLDWDDLFCILFFCFEALPAMFICYSWLCTQEAVLVLLRRPCGVPKIKPEWARQKEQPHRIELFKGWFQAYY